MKVYKTFEEIDRDLKILRLQSKIEKEQLKIGISEIKEDLSPISMAGNFVGNIAKKAVFLKTLNTVLNHFRR